MLIRLFQAFFLPLREAKEDQDNLTGVPPADSSILSNPFWLISIYHCLAIPCLINTFVG